MDKQHPKPFDCSYSPQFADLLHKLGISLVISTYQAGKVIVLSAVNSDKLTQLPRTFENAMGIAVNNTKLAVSTKNEVVVLQNRPELASSYANKKGVYDGIYIPAVRYNTGYLALHDMEFTNNKLVAVNTIFSCLSYIDDEYSFKPFWQPPFVSELTPEDRCHLNGMAIENNEIKYLTALGNTNVLQGWRDKKMNGGILIEYPSGKIILQGLAMPHSPRMYNGKLYLLNSAKGELICVNPENGSYELVVKLGGYARGMARCGDYLFIGLSKLRHNSKIFSDLEIAKTSYAGVVAVYLPYKAVVGCIKYEMSVDEIYDVKILENSIRPSIISPEMTIHGHAICTPLGSFWSIPEKSEASNETKLTEVYQSDKHLYTEQIQIQQLKSVSADNLISNFPNLLFPICLRKFQIEKHSRNLIAFLGKSGEKPVALIVSEVKADKTAELNSVFVSEGFRKKGIGSMLLKQNNKLLVSNGIQYIDVSWPEIISEAKSFKQLLLKNNWLPIQKSILNVKVDVEDALKSKWVKNEPDIKADIKIFDWAKVDEQEVKLIMKEKKVPKYLTPLQFPRLLNTKISKFLYINGQIAGWCIFHNVKPDTVQGSALFIAKELRNKFVSIKLLVDCLTEAHKNNIRFIIYQSNYQNHSLIRYLSILTPPTAVVKKYCTLSSRKHLSLKQ